MSFAAPQFARGPEEDGLAWLRNNAFCLLGSPGGDAPSADDLPPGTVRLETSLQVLEFVKRNPGAFVFLRPDAVAETDLEMLSRISHLDERSRLIPVARWESVPDALNLARRLGLGHLLPVESLGRPEEAARWLELVRQGASAADLEGLLGPGAEIVHRAIRTRSDRNAAIEEVLRYFAEGRSNEAFAYALRLTLEEALNNAIFHGFRTADGNEKYRIGEFESLDPSESVHIRYGSEGTRAGILIEDNGGTLTRDLVLKNIERHLSPERVHDESGRGLFLLYSLATAMTVTLKSGLLTRVTVVLDASRTSGPERPSAKPLFIFD